MNEQRWSKAQDRFNKWMRILVIIMVASLALSIFAPVFLLLFGLCILGMYLNVAAFNATVPREMRDKKKAEREEQKRRDTTPVSAVLVSTQDVTGKSVIDTAARAAVGDALFGTFGAAVGISTAKTKVVEQKAVFSVEYETGRVGTETVTIGSDRFNKLMALTHK